MKLTGYKLYSEEQGNSHSKKPNEDNGLQEKCMVKGRNTHMLRKLNEE